MLHNIILANASQKSRPFLNLISVLLILLSCNTKRNLQGTYRSNKAVLGFFVTTVELNNNDKFNYEFSGDLQHTELSGMYKVKGNSLYLKFNKNKNEPESTNDSLIISDILSGNYHNYDLKNESGINYHLKYKIQGNRFFAYNVKTGKLIKKSKIYSDQKRFLFFGSKWKNKKSYLKKIK
ncbi:hypothetical protein CEY12_11280 [Chryseobacterium sp. T16E-39]|uniref:hypothetical protein n=1 Tax=Chryseobacterium sp. T16E-39 TaxID=2015076 RepID=UPI000B5B1E1E|nr:hypothetical protein [Chryseobacterium sp. T16E-39]ASK30659.1 hypothetical protein CEY12_11280 [Chryseobacterium sp. T16E-39]